MVISTLSPVPSLLVLEKSLNVPVSKFVYQKSVYGNVVVVVVVVVLVVVVVVEVVDVVVVVVVEVVDVVVVVPTSSVFTA